MRNVSSPAQGETTFTTIDGDSFYGISNSHEMPEFFMSIVGCDDHWMFLSSRGAVTAGRRNPDSALFPYATDDQLSARQDSSGPVTWIRVINSARNCSNVWKPFNASAGLTAGSVQNLYKAPLAGKILFEECNDPLGLTFRYGWAFSSHYGFVRDCFLENRSAAPVTLELLDGLIDILPHGVGSEFLMRFSNLANAYKKSELVPESGAGLFYLSSIPTDRAEPSEGLRATTVWQKGLDPDTILLSTRQMECFLDGRPITDEHDVRGHAGAYLVTKRVTLRPGDVIRWRIVAELGKDQTDVIELDHWLRSAVDHGKMVDEDIRQGERRLLELVGSADGIQCGQNRHRVNRHFANTLFNVMRGGIPLRDYEVTRDDFCATVARFNRTCSERHRNLLTDLPESLDAANLNSRLEATGDQDLIRLGLEYLPLAFSRRHGDPTRPWNRFSIELHGADGQTNLDYQGNWRDIFQNWEALGHSFPDFLTAMICRFVNATTADGYNPYRITKNGFEWEAPSPDDPWANIGYWSDHQIIYLLKLLEWNHRFHPARSHRLLASRIFVHAEVPYRIRTFEEIRNHPRDTIVFDWERSNQIAKRVSELGEDGKLVRDRTGRIHRVSLAEKLLILSLAKLTNFVPEGGIWLNTQRPEWNDANNALVGQGLSMVTTCYLHRWFSFLHGWFNAASETSMEVSIEVVELLDRVTAALRQFNHALTDACDDQTRMRIVQTLSRAGSDFRQQLYETGPSGQTAEIATQSLATFAESARKWMERTIRVNRRTDALYHAYNLLNDTGTGFAIERLDEMLEGQVAVLSSGVLTADESIQLLNALRTSRLFRENQNSFLLYPDRNLPRFLDKNCLPRTTVDSCPLLQELIEQGDESIVRRDVHGEVHFNGDFRNRTDCRMAMDALDSTYDELVARDGEAVLSIFEDLFDHRRFTGRSGTFFAYEGLGSIYWHMVSKLRLAVTENLERASAAAETDDRIASLKAHLTWIRQGIGAEKMARDYGAFPFDPYSHTPENAGVKQPGMTGQVKEDVLARFAELGVAVRQGCLHFHLDLFDRSELLRQPGSFPHVDNDGQLVTVNVPENAFGFTLFRVPVIYLPGHSDEIRLTLQDGTCQSISGHCLDAATSRGLFARSGRINRIECLWTALLE